MSFTLTHAFEIQRPNKDLINLFIASTFRKAAITSLSIFSSIYIFTVLAEKNIDVRFAFALSVIFYFILYIFKMISLLLSENISQIIGFKNTIRISILFFILMVPFMILAEKYPIFFIFGAMFWGINAGFYWWGHHGYFIKSESNSNFGKSIGKLALLDAITQSLTPFVTGFIIYFFGYQSLYVLCLILVIVSAMTLGKDHEKKQRRDIKAIDVLGLIKKHLSVSTIYASTSAESVVYAFIWPIFIYLTLGSILEIGGIISLSFILASVFTLYVGRISDQKRGGEMVLLGSPLVMISWLIRIISKGNVAYIISADSVRNFGERMVFLPLNALTYKKSEENGLASAILFRELNFIFGGFAMMIISIVVIFLGANIYVIFLLAMIVSIYPTFAVIFNKFKDE